MVIDVDPVFDGTEEWYEQMAKSRPPKDKPWYHVLVHGSDVQTYVAERNLEPDTEGGPIVHPHVDVIFEGLADGEYIPRSKVKLRQRIFCRFCGQTAWNSPNFFGDEMKILHR